MFGFLLELSIHSEGDSYSIPEEARSAGRKVFFDYPNVVHGIVLPSDVDHHMHMNNSKYLREMDFGRQMYFESGMSEAMRGSTRIVAISIRYSCGRGLHSLQKCYTGAIHFTLNSDSSTRTDSHVPSLW